MVWALALVLTGCAAAPQAAEEGEVLLTVNGREIAAGEYLCWLDLALGAWAQMPDEEACAAAKAQALADTVLYAVVGDMAAEYGVVLSEGELLSSQQPAARSELFYQKLCAGTYPEEVLGAFAEEQGYRTVERVLIPAGEGARERAAEVFTRLNGGGEEALVDVKRSYSDPQSPYTISPGSKVLAETLVQAALLLDPGEYSGILETEEGFSVLYCTETDLASLTVPWVDHCLLRRVREADVRLHRGYAQAERYASVFSTFGNDA
jgi:hypothetical protein